MIDQYIQKLKDHTQTTSDGESILTLLYEAYSEIHRLDNDHDFKALYSHMNGMTLHEMDHILDPVCSLCRSHQQSGFVEGMKVGLIFGLELL